MSNKTQARIFSVKVTKQLDLGTHVLFIGEVVNAEVLSDVPSMKTYFLLPSGKRRKNAS